MSEVNKRRPKGSPASGVGLCGLSKLLRGVGIEVLTSLFDSMLHLKEVVGYFDLSRAKAGGSRDKTRPSARKWKRVSA